MDNKNEPRGKLTWRDFAALRVNYFELLMRKDDDGGPWMPSSLYTFVFIPIVAIALSLWTVGFENFTVVEFILFIIGYLLFYFVVFHSWFYIRRWRWEKRQGQDRDH